MREGMMEKEEGKEERRKEGKKERREEGKKGWGWG